MHGYVLNVMSADHPGIVAHVGTAVERLGGNILSCSQTVLDGYFTLIMHLELPESPEPDAFADAVRNAPELGAAYKIVACREERPRRDAKTGGPCEIYIITVFGTDRPGIIRQFTSYLSGRDINIADLYGSRTEQAGTGDGFMLIGQLEVPGDVDIRLLQDDLEGMGRELAFTVRLQHNNIFTATNRLS